VLCMKLLESEYDHPQHLPVAKAYANNTLDDQRFTSGNAIMIDEEEWAIPPDAAGLVTFTIHLKQEGRVVSLSLIQGGQGRIFTKMRVQSKQGGQELTIPPKDDGGCLHHLWLQHPIQGQEFDLIFDADSVSGISGSTGLMYVALAGYVSEPAGGDELQGSKHSKKRKGKK